MTNAERLEIITLLRLGEKVNYITSRSLWIPDPRENKLVTLQLAQYVIQIYKYQGVLDDKGQLDYGGRPTTRYVYVDDVPIEVFSAETWRDALLISLEGYND